MAEAVNIHGTAIVIGQTGLLFLGPSGIGKSSLAFACLASARQLGLSSALVADDRVLISNRNRSVLAECPPSIAGLIEIRGTGILRIASVSSSPMHFAVLPVNLATADRLPPENAEIEVSEGNVLPAIHVSSISINPLAIIMAMQPSYF